MRRLWAAARGVSLLRQPERHLPGEHFLLTFTVPEPLRGFLRRQQRIGYGALFSASAGAIKKLAADAKYIGGDLTGFFGVLHTWGRTLQFHPPYSLRRHRGRADPRGRALASGPARILSARARPVADLSGQVPRRHREAGVARGGAG